MTQQWTSRIHPATHSLESPSPADNPGAPHIREKQIAMQVGPRAHRRAASSGVECGSEQVELEGRSRRCRMRGR